MRERIGGCILALVLALPLSGCGFSKPVQKPAPGTSLLRNEAPDADLAALMARRDLREVVLAKLKAYDSIYEAGYTLSGTRITQDAFALVARAQIRVRNTWRLTVENGRCGYVSVVTDYDKPTFHKRESGRVGRVGGLSYDADGWMLAAILTKRWGYWGEDVSGHADERTLIRVSPANEAVEYGKMHDASLYGPQDVGPNVPRRIVLWSSGRFYSKLIEEITGVSQSANGGMTVSALGSKGEGESGRWELQIEPTAAWMVRQARFYSDRAPEEINCEMKNSGTAWSGSYCIPQNALFNYGGPIQGDGPVELTFDPRVENFDEKLYDDAKQAVTKDRPPKLTVHDYRVEPPRIFQPDHK